MTRRVLAFMSLCLALAIANSADHYASADIDYFLGDGEGSTTPASAASTSDAVLHTETRTAAIESASQFPPEPLPAYVPSPKYSQQPNVMTLDLETIKACMESLHPTSNDQAPHSHFEKFLARRYSWRDLLLAFVSGVACSALFVCMQKCCCCGCGVQSSPNRGADAEDAVDAHAAEQLRNFMWLGFVWRALLLALAASIAFEAISVIGHSYADYQSAIANPPAGCLHAGSFFDSWPFAPDSALSSSISAASKSASGSPSSSAPHDAANNRGWLSSASSTIAAPFVATHRWFFEPARASDCAHYHRRTNLVLIFATNPLEIVSRAATKVAIAPLSVLIDVVGDSMRVLFDKFSASEKALGAVLVLVFLIAISAIVIPILATRLATKAAAQQPSQSAMPPAQSPSLAASSKQPMLYFQSPPPPQHLLRYQVGSSPLPSDAGGAGASAGVYMSHPHHQHDPRQGQGQPVFYQHVVYASPHPPPLAPSDLDHQLADALDVPAAVSQRPVLSESSSAPAQVVVTRSSELIVAASSLAGAAAAHAVEPAPPAASPSVPSGGASSSASPLRERKRGKKGGALSLSPEQQQAQRPPAPETGRNSG